MHAEREQDPLAAVQLVLAVTVQHTLEGPLVDQLPHPLDLHRACVNEYK